MMGWCLGGLLCLLYQGLAKDKHLRNIVTVASPIDVESGKGTIAAVAGIAEALDGPVQMISNYSNVRLNTLDPARLSLPEWATTLVFKMTDPVGSVTGYWDLFMRMSDREFVESYSTKADYLNNMLRYPGGVLRDMASSVMGDNELVSGKVCFGDYVAELDTIESSLLAFAGETDNLVPPEVAEKIIDVVASTDVEFRVAPGGHMGVIIGSKAQNAVWSESVAWLAERSAATTGKKVRRNRKRVAKPAAKAQPKSRAAAEATPKAASAKTRVKAQAKAKARTKAKPKPKAKAKAKAKPKVRAKSKVEA